MPFLQKGWNFVNICLEGFENFSSIPSLTKDNLAKRNWHGSQKCCFCNCNETIKHLFFDSQHAKTISRIVHIATGLTPPRSITHMLRNWLTGVGGNERKLILVGVAALLWAIWCTRMKWCCFRKETIYFFYALPSGEHIGCGFGYCCCVRMQRKPFNWRAEHRKLWH